jgi:hypothetical protein
VRGGASHSVRLAGARATLLAAVLAIGCGGATPSGAADSSAPAAGAAPAASAVASASATAGFEARMRGYALGERYRYALRTSNTVRFGDHAPSFDFDLTATVDVIPHAVTNEQVSAYLALSDVHRTNRAAGGGQDLDRLVSELGSQGVFITLRAGRVSELGVPLGMSGMAANTYRELASALQCVRSSSAAARYTVDEYDTTGLHIAEYERGADDLTWHKRTLRYLNLLGVKMDRAAQAGVRELVPEVRRSVGELRLSPEGRPVFVKLSQELAMTGTQTPMQSTLSLELAAQRAPDLPPKLDVSALLEKTRRYAADEPIQVAADPANLDAARIGGLDFATIVRQLERIAQRQKAVSLDPAHPDAVESPESRGVTEATVGEQARLFSALTATFRQEPSSIERAVSLIRGRSAASDVLLDALGSASTGASHGALARLLGTTKLDREVRARIIVSLARVQKATAEASRALLAVLEKEPFQAGALYGLGTHARLLRDEGRVTEANTLGEFLVARLGRAREPVALVRTLRAIGNSGYDAALPLVRPHLLNDSEQVRSAAVRALQTMSDPNVDALIVSRLETDADTAVRVSAIEAARLRDPNDLLVKALEGAGRAASDSHVRYRAVDVMAQWLPKRPELRASLQRIADRDGEQRVRDRARTAL